VPHPIKTPGKRPAFEPEEFLRAEGLQDWLTENLKTVVAVVGVLVLAASAWGIVEFLQHRAEAQAAELYAKAMKTYQAAQAPDLQLRVLSPETISALQQAAQEFQAVQEDYPRTQHAALAMFSQANAYATLGQFDEAIAAYEAWLTEYAEHPLKPLVIQRLAYALWSKGKPEDAVTRFGEVTTIPDAPNRDLAYFEKGRVLEQMGQNAQALEAYSTLAKEFTSSPWASEGNARIIALGGVPPGREPEPVTAPSDAPPQPATPQGQNPPASPSPPPTP
jgi:predicted negative regulator of RcsB-dependent stress response